MTSESRRAHRIAGELGGSVWLLLLVCAAAVGAMVPLTGAIAAPIGIAAVIGVLAAAWILASSPRAIALYAFLLPFDVYLSTTLRMTSTQAFQALVLGGTATSALLAIGTVRQRHHLPRTIMSLGIALIAYLSLSISWSISPDASARSLLRTVTAILMAALAALYIRDRSTLRRVLAAAALGAVLTALYGYAQFFRGGYDALYQYFSPFYNEVFAARGGGFSVVATFVNPNILAGYGAIVLPMIWALVADSRGARRAGWLAASVMVSGVVLLTYSKTGWLLVALLGSLWIATRVTTGSRLAMVASAGVLLGLVLLMLDPLRTTFSDVFPNSREASIDTRLGLWRASIAAFLQHPLLGFGLDGFAAATAATRTGVLADLVRAHNIYLQTLVDVGIVGSVLLWAPLLLVYVSGVKALLREPPTNRDPLQLGLVLSATGFFLFGLVETLNVSNGYVNAYWLAFGLLSASTQMRAQAPNAAESGS